MKNTMLLSARKRAGLTQAQLAEKASISALSYQRYEYGEREPSVDTALRIAKALGTTVERLFSSGTDR